MNFLTRIRNGELDMQELQCETVAPLYAATIQGGNLLICMKLARMGSLHNMLGLESMHIMARRGKAYPPLDALLRWGAQTAAGLEGMHMCCVVYCDLKVTFATTLQFDYVWPNIAYIAVLHTLWQLHCEQSRLMLPVPACVSLTCVTHAQSVLPRE